VILDEDSMEEMECTEEINSIYSLSYFVTLMKFVGDGIEIQMGDAYPMRIDFEIANGEGNVTYVLAPRVEQEE